MVNKGQIHRESRKNLMISLNLIKSDDEMMTEIGQLEDKSMESEINEFGSDFAEKSSNEQR